MKQALSIVALFLAFTIFPPEASGQVKINLQKKLNKQADTRANKNTDKALDKGFDKLEDGIQGILKKKDDKAIDDGKNADASTAGKTENQANENKQSGSNRDSKNNSPILSWAKYDFVPGDKIIFEDNLIGEENGEFPSRWDLVKGAVENAEFGGESVIMFRGGDPTIVPYLKNPESDYLPEVFTIEFDLYLPNNTFTIYFFDRKNQNRPAGETYLNITSTTMALHPAKSNLPDNGSISNKWAHISVAYTSGKLKAYIDDTRLINIPHLEFNPSGITLNAYHANDNRRYYVKNFRLAEGGVKYYDKFLQDGKIVSNGIRFDVGKATLRPESMGVLNEIYKMLSEHSDVAVSVEGHTDSDGDTDLNQKLSEDRAQTVMEKLVSMGLSKERLSYRGHGESKPVAPNDTPEGKASNRRVEFVKKSDATSQNSSPSAIAQTVGNNKAAKNSGDSPQRQDLFNAVRDNDIGKVKELIAAGADVNMEDDWMGSPLSLAKDIEMMEVLISDGADINHRDKRTGYTHLMNALNSCNKKVAKFLIEKGADINLKSNDGATALILACGCSEEISKQLLEKGADVHALTDRGMGAFTQCTGIGLTREVVTYEFAEFLLEKGADINETNTTDYYGGYTPLLWAVESNEEKLVSFLLKHGANINAKSNKGKTPLSIASETGNENIVKILKAAGAK